MRPMKHWQEYEHIHNWNPRRRGKNWANKNIWRTKGWNLPNFIYKCMKLHIKQSQCILIKMNTKRHLLRHMINLSKGKKNFRKQQESNNSTIQEISNRINRAVLIKNYQGLKKVAWHFEVLKGKQQQQQQTYQPKILYPIKILKKWRKKRDSLR